MKILIATDGSEFSDAAAKACCKMISFEDEVAIKVISIVEVVAPPMRPFSKDKYLAQEEAARNAAEIMVGETRLKMREWLDEKFPEIETEIIRGDPKSVILKEAEEWKADLIVVGSHGHGFWERMLLGSVSAAVVNYARCSVLVVRKELS